MARGFIRSRSLIWLHSGEEKHLFDVIRVGQEHSQTIDTHAPSSGGRQTVLESLDEGLIHALCLIVAVILGLRLLLEALKLNLWVIQLRVGVDDLMLVRK